jgi:uncharacterized membrane protein
VTPSRRLALGLRALVVVAGALPWALALFRVGSPAVVAAFASLCHQLPERTLLLLGAPMVVCSRCAGIYAGALLGALVPMPRRVLPHARRLIAAAAALMVLDVVTQDLGLHAPYHPVRLFTGLALGVLGASWMSRALSDEADRLGGRDSARPW